MDILQFAGLAGVVLITMLLGAFIAALCQSEERERLEAAQKKAEAELRKAQEQLAQERATMAGDCQAAEEELAAKLKAMEAESAERAAVEARAIIEKAAALVPTLDQCIDQSQDYAAIDKLLRDAQLKRLVRGNVLIVKYLASPTGRYAIEWTTTDTRLLAPVVTLHCDKRMVMRDVGTANRYGGTLSRGSTAKIELQAQRDNGKVCDTVSFEIYMPTVEEWGDSMEPIKPDDPAKAMERQVKAELSQAAATRQLRKGAYQDIDAADDLTDEEKDDCKADVDGAIAKVREQFQS